MRPAEASPPAEAAPFRLHHASSGAAPRAPDLFSERRSALVESLRRSGVRDEAVLAAIGKVPRHLFVPAGFEAEAYDDRPLPIGEGQTISQPFIVARMLEAAALRPGEALLDVGTGSGYSAAVATALGARVVSVERRPGLALEAYHRLHALGYDVAVLVGDGSLGLPDAAPFDAIVVAAGAPKVPEVLRDQLAPGGRLVMPVGPMDQQRLVRLVRGPTGFTEEHLLDVRFVPLVGREGFADPHGLPMLE